MAIYTNLTEVTMPKHGVWRSSLLRSTIAGHILDARVQGTVDGQVVDIAVDNGVALKLGDWTHDGLQERLATIAGVKDKIVVTGSPAIVKDAFTKAQAAETNFYFKAGQLARVYQIEGDAIDGDIFGVGDFQFTNTDKTEIAVGNYVVVDGNGKWTAIKKANKPSASAYGFIGQIQSIQTGMEYSIVNIFAIQNVDNN